MPHRPTRRSTRATAVATTLALAGLVLASGCGADSASANKTSTTAAPSDAGTAAPVQSGLVKISAVDNNFKAEDVTVTAGSQISWTNSGRNDHNVTPDPANGGGDYGVATDKFKPGETYTTTFATPGTYHYFCSIHGTNERGMVGTVTVVAS